MPKLADLDGPDRLKRMQNMVSWAETGLKKFRDRGEENWKYYELKNPVYTRGGQKVRVPTVVENVDSMHAALTSFEIVPVVTPKAATPYQLAVLIDRAIKAEWEELEVVRKSDPALKDALIPGIGFMLVEYDYAEETEEQPLGRGTDPDTGEEVDLVEEVTYAVRDQARVRYIPWDEVFFDPEAKTWDDVAWVCHKYTMPLEDMKEDEELDSKARSELQRDTVVAFRTGDDSHVAPEEERVTCYKFYDLRGDSCYLFAENAGRILKEYTNPFGARYEMKDRNPFVPYVTRSFGGRVWGLSDTDVMRPSVDEQNIVRSNIATHVDRLKVKLVAEDGVIDNAGKRALKSQEWGEVVTVRAGALSQGQILKPLEMPTMPQEAFFHDGQAKADSRSAIGLNELLRGELPAGRKTATAMEFMAQASTVRQSEKRNSLERFYKDIADRILYLMKTLYEDERLTRLTGDDGTIVAEWKGQDLDVDYILSVDIEPREILDTQAKQEKYMALKNVFGVDPTIKQENLNRYLMQAFGIPEDVIEDLVMTTEELNAMAMAQEQQQMGMMAAEAGFREQTQAPEPAVPAFPGAEVGTALAGGEQ